MKINKIFINLSCPKPLNFSYGTIEKNIKTQVKFLQKPNLFKIKFWKKRKKEKKKRLNYGLLTKNLKSGID